MAELGPGLLTPAQCPHHTLPTSDVGETSLVWPLLVSLFSLSPDLPKITRSGTGANSWGSWEWEQIGCKMPLLGLPKGPPLWALGLPFHLPAPDPAQQHLLTAQS